MHSCSLLLSGSGLFWTSFLHHNCIFTVMTEETSKLAEAACLQGIGKMVKETGGLMQEGSVLSRVANITKARVRNVQSITG